MGRKDRARIRGWAESLIAEHGADVAALVGVEPPLPRVTVEVLPGQGPPGQTSGLRITLSERWFLEHPDDAGCVIHELAHAYMRAPRYDHTTSWLIEGLADFVRDALHHGAWRGRKPTSKLVRQQPAIRRPPISCFGSTTYSLEVAKNSLFNS